MWGKCILRSSSTIFAIKLEWRALREFSVPTMHVVFAIPRWRPVIIYVARRSRSDGEWDMICIWNCGHGVGNSVELARVG